MKVSRKALSVSAIIFTVASIAAAFLMMPYAFDDFLYMEFLKVTVDGIPSPIDWSHFYDMWAWRYMNDNIRLANLTCVFSFYLPKWVMDILAATLFMCAILVALRLARIDIRRSGAVTFLCLLLSVFPVWYDYILSLDFYLNYIPSTAFALTAVWLAIRRQRFNAFWTFALGGLTGAWHEAFGLTALCTILGLMVLHKRLRRRHVVWMLVGLALGSAFLLKAKGFHARWAARGQLLEVYQFLESAICAWPALLFMLLQGIEALRHRHRFMGDIFRQALFLMALGGSLFMVASPSPRTTWFGQVAGCIGLAAMAAQWRLPDQVRRVGTVIAVALLVARWTVAFSVVNSSIVEYKNVLNMRLCNCDTTVYVDITEYPQQPIWAIGLPGLNQFNYLSGYEYYKLDPDANFKFVARPLKNYRQGLGRLLPSGEVTEYEHALVAPLPDGYTGDSHIQRCYVSIDSPLVKNFKSDAIIIPFFGVDGGSYGYVYITTLPIFIHTINDLRIISDFEPVKRL